MNNKIINQNQILILIYSQCKHDKIFYLIIFLHNKKIKDE
jgi:hypothetical protein